MKKQKKEVKRLKLHRETVYALSQPDLKAAAAGAGDESDFGLGFCLERDSSGC